MGETILVVTERERDRRKLSGNTDPYMEGGKDSQKEEIWKNKKTKKQNQADATLHKFTYIALIYIDSVIELYTYRSSINLFNHLEIFFWHDWFR